MSSTGRLSAAVMLNWPPDKPFTVVQFQTQLRAGGADLLATAWIVNMAGVEKFVPDGVQVALLDMEILAVPPGSMRPLHMTVAEQLR